MVVLASVVVDNVVIIIGYAVVIIVSATVVVFVHAVVNIVVFATAFCKFYIPF